MQALRHKDPIWADQIAMSTRDWKNHKAARAREFRKREAANLNVARSLDPKPVKSTQIEVFETASGQRYYEVMKEGGKVRLPYVSILGR